MDKTKLLGGEEEGGVEMREGGIMGEEGEREGWREGREGGVERRERGRGGEEGETCRYDSVLLSNLLITS